MVSFIKNHWPVLTLLLIEIILFLTNFKPGTFLVGWDNLLPELNFGENLKRGIFSVWQEYRGLGLLDSMAHAANLPHTLFLWLLSFFLPVNILRWFFVFLMHFIGGWGMYILLSKKICSGRNNKFIPFLGALFYLFNLAAVQMFYAPLEVFVTHFAFLPWLIFSLLNFLENKNRKSLFLFMLFSFLSLPQGFVPQVFLAYLVMVFLVLLFNLLKEKKLAIKSSVIVLLTILLINSYWLFPYSYSALNNSSTILEAKINQMSTEDIYLKNKARGGLADVLLLKGFMLDTKEFNNQGEFSYIMGQWREHLDIRPVKLISYLLMVLGLMGIINSVIRKDRRVWPFLGAAGISIFFLGSDIWGLREINGFLRDNLPIFNEAFRFSFTKFAIILAFCYSLFLALGWELLSGLVKKAKLVISLVMISLLLFYTLPAFTGNFIFNSLKLHIQSDYFKTIDFFNNQDSNIRIATLPQPSFWSWRYFENGYRGSGFLWYGIEQPTMDRAFDPWSRENENYYWELSYAVYSKNKDLLEQVLEKYQINWLLIDSNVVNPPSSKALYIDELVEMLLVSDKVQLVENFNKIKIYEVSLEAKARDFVYVLDNPPVVEPVYKWGNYDRAFIENGNYVTQAVSGKREVEKYYPFRSVFTRSSDELEFQIEDKGDYFAFIKRLPQGLENYILEIPDINPLDLQWVDPEHLEKVKYLLRDVYFNGNVVEVKVPKVGGYYSSIISVDREVSESLSFYLPNLPHKNAYLITVESENKRGKPLLFWLENLNSRKADIETYLPAGKQALPNPKTYNLQPITSYFIQPPMEEDGVAYSLHFDKSNIGNEKQINTLGKITVNPIPYQFLTSLVLSSTAGVNLNHPGGVNLEFKVSHPNPSLYQAVIEPSNPVTQLPSNLTLVLSQSFSEGWKAYRIMNYESGIMNYLATTFPFIFGREIIDNVLVNNWANGWKIDRCGVESVECKITIIFLPQYLEYLGFLLIGGFLGYISISGFFHQPVREGK